MNCRSWLSLVSQTTVYAVSLIGGYCRAQVPNDGVLLLEQCVASESVVVSGKSTVSQEERRTVVSDQEIRNGITSDPKRLETELDWNRNYPESVRSDLTILFDNQKSVYKIRSRRNLETAAENILHFTPDIYRVYNTDAKNHRKDFGVYPAHWPPSWPHNVFRNRFWSGRLSLVSRKVATARIVPSAETGVVVLELIGDRGKGGTIDQRIWVDVSKGYTPKRLELWDKPVAPNGQDVPFSGKLAERCDFVYSVDDEGAWYISQLKDSMMNLNNGKTASTTVSTVRKFDRNISLNLAQLAPDKPSEGTIVQDERFVKPIIYTQGKKHYSDAELINISKGLSFLERPGEQLPIHRGVRRATKYEISPYIYLGVACFCFSVITFLAARYLAKKEATRGN